MSDRKLMQQALHTLEGWANVDDWVWPETAKEQAKRNTVDAIDALRERLAQPEQEPVAWMVYTLDGKSVCVTDNPSDFTPEHHALPLYTAPVDGVTISEERVDEMVKTEHDKQIEIAQAYERGWNAALAQQEPVAWMGAHDKTDLYYRKPPQADVIPLYTAPPQRKPLTDEECLDLFSETHWRFETNILKFARAIEAAHGIKEKNT